MTDITARVEQQQQVPKRPTMYAVQYWSGTRWQVGYESDSESWVRMMANSYAQSRIVIIPGDDQQPAGPEDGTR